MFSKGSRYRNLPESAALTAQGERLRGKELRRISRLPGRFQHIVRDGDRLDLLAFKYYGDPSRWWQIADANTEFEFPVDLLDGLPFVEERFVLRHQQFFDSFENLRTALAALGDVSAGELSPFEGDVMAVDPDFIETTIVVVYDGSPALRQQIIAEIRARFDLLRAFAWPQDGKTAEAFTFDDQSVKSQWQSMIADLAVETGVTRITSAITDRTVEVAYHSARISHQTIAAIIGANGFAIQSESSAVLLRTGARIVIPPNQVV
ncbi:MAG TPA: hypothetical protein VFV34_14050 [Blastocatellia bacterium]|nr:hypothetical protein [Blastocatellia bacterium]